MSSSMYKPVFAHIITLFLVTQTPFLLNHQHASLVAADQSKDVEPGYHMQATAGEETEEEIKASYLIQNLGSQENVLINEMSSLESMAPAGGWKTTLGDCVSAHVQADKDLDQALDCLKKHDFYSAKKYVDSALMRGAKCHWSIAKGKWKLGKTIYKAMKTHEQLYQQTIQFLGSISHHQGP